MTIAVLCGHFIPELGYHEVSLAKSFSRLGHKVHIITSRKIPVSVKNKYNIKLENSNLNDIPFPYSISRLKSLISFRSIVVPLGLNRKIKEITPDLIILFGIGKMFHVPFLLSFKKKRARIISYFGDNEDMKRTSVSGKNIYRRFLYRRAIMISDRAVLYTPSTMEIISKITGLSWYNKYKSKQVESSLGFDDEMFFFDRSIRNNVRSRLGICNNEIVLIYSSRVIPGKGLENIIKAADECMSEGMRLRMIIIGIFNDDYGNIVRHYISQLSNSQRFHLYGFLCQNEINSYFNCADAGVWGQVTVSIQQAMGTGLYVILPERKSVSHLINRQINGSYYYDKTTLIESIRLLKGDIQREGRALFNQKFNNLNLSRKILEVTFPHS